MSSHILRILKSYLFTGFHIFLAVFIDCYDLQRTCRPTCGISGEPHEVKTTTVIQEEDCCSYRCIPVSALVLFFLEFEASLVLT